MAAPRKFTNWPDAVQYLSDLLKKMQPLAGPGITIEQTANGRKIRSMATGDGGGSGEYDGPFAVRDYSDDTGLRVFVEDGAYPDEDKAGYYEHGTNAVAVPSSDIIDITASGWVWIKITWSSSAYVFEYGFSATSAMPSNAAGTIYRRLAYVEVDSGAIQNIQQYQRGNLTTPGVF